jgi:hypothetical protein
MIILHGGRLCGKPCVLAEGASGLAPVLARESGTF